MRPLLLAGLLLASAARAQAPSPAGSVSTQAPGGPDAALVGGLVAASAPAPEEVRVIAIEDLALLGDARALEPLAALMWDPNPRVQQAAVRAVALFQHPQAERILADVVRHPARPEALKLLALGGLLFQRTGSARAVLEETARDARASAAVQSTALTLAARWEALPPPEAARQSPREAAKEFPKESPK